MKQDLYPIIGMSPGNSYFKDEEIKYLLKTTVERYGRVAIMIADVPAISTYIALGYPENRARKDKAIPQGNLLKNRTERAIAQLEYTKDQVKIIDWAEEVEPNADYQASYKNIRKLYEENSLFENDADETTKGVIVGSKKEIPNVIAATKIAVHYLLSEFAFLDFAPKFLNTEKVVYIYHKNWPVYENYIAGKYDRKSKSYIDFLLMENPWETYRSVWGGEDEDSQEYDSVLDRVEKTKTLRVAFSNYPPTLIHNKDTDTFSGIFYEIINSIATKNIWKLVWSEETGYGVVTDGLNHDRFDVFGSTIWPTPERIEKATFSESLYESKVHIWSSKDASLDTLKDNSGLRIVVKENDISHSIASADFPNARLVYVPQLSETQELLQFVTENKGDLTFAESYLVEDFMKKSQAILVKVDTNPIRTYENTFIFKHSDATLKEIFDIEISRLKETGELTQLIEKYTGSKDTFE